MPARAHSPRIIAKARKVFALLKSPEKEEADNAQRRWQELQSKHGIKESDIIEDVIESVDSEVDPFREWLSVLIGALRECSSVVHRREGIGFKGRPQRVAVAKELYVKVIREAESAPMPDIAPWFQDSARDVWKFYWKMAFIDRMNVRFPQRPKVEPTEPKPKPSRSSEPIDESKVDWGEDRFKRTPKGSLRSSPPKDFAEARAGAERLAHNVDLGWLEREARRAGASSADTISIQSDYLELET
jgi:hypothetical protein